jgi:rSAM/selenodomain-associated transferase 2
MSQSPTYQPLRLSVIIPALNEAQVIARAIESVYDRAVRQRAAVESLRPSCEQSLVLHEVLLVDGGSVDDTCSRAKRLAQRSAYKNFRIVHLPSTQRTCRANQQNWGARLAQGDILLFLHADTTLPFQYPQVIARTLGLIQTNTSGESKARMRHPALGAFSLEFTESSWVLRLVAWGANLRSRLFRAPYGDQGIFLRKQTFQDLEGFPADWPLLDDVALGHRALRRFGWGNACRIAPEHVQTSARRYQKLGVLNTVLLNQCILLGFALGVPVDALARWYRAPRTLIRDALLWTHKHENLSPAVTLRLRRPSPTEAFTVAREMQAHHRAWISIPSIFHQNGAAQEKPTASA